MNRRQRTGRSGERLARAFLLAKGWRIIEANWRCRAGEIDLIAEDGGMLVFVEVRTRTGFGTARGTPLESVDERKRRQVRRLAAVYLSLHGAHGRDVRFDVVAVRMRGTAADEAAEIEHIANAF
jgi:putative endonuclease